MILKDYKIKNSNNGSLFHLCNNCLQLKNVSDFHKQKETPTGYAYVCRDCFKIKYGPRKKKNNSDYYKNNKEVWKQKYYKYVKKNDRVSSSENKKIEIETQ